VKAINQKIRSTSYYT